MFYNLLKVLDKKVSFLTVSAKSYYQNYDPISMQLTALTLIRNTELVAELQDKTFLTAQEQIKYNNLLKLKCQNSIKIKEELILLLKKCHKAIPNEELLIVELLLNDTFIDIEINSHKITKKLSHHILTTTNRLVEMYWDSRGIQTYLAQCSSPIDHFLCVRF